MAVCQAKGREMAVCQAKGREMAVCQAKGRGPSDFGQVPRTWPKSLGPRPNSVALSTRNISEAATNFLFFLTPRSPEARPLWL